MNPELLLSIIGSRDELKYLFITLLTIIVLVPLLSLQVISSVGLKVVSSALVNRIEEGVYELLNPDGSVYTTFKGKFSWPTEGTVTQEFSEKYHTGLDIAKKGAVVYPAIAGKVVYVGEDPKGYGKHVIVDHGNTLTTLYAHLDKIYVKTDQGVNISDIIGLQGNSGNTRTIGQGDGTHLHFEVNRNTKILGLVHYSFHLDPRIFFESSVPN